MDLEERCEWKVDIDIAKSMGEEAYNSFLRCYEKKMKSDKCPECTGKDKSKGCFIPERKLNYLK